MLFSARFCSSAKKIVVLHIPIRVNSTVYLTKRKIESDVIHILKNNFKAIDYVTLTVEELSSADLYVSIDDT